MSDLPDEIARINAITANARSTWFVLLGVLAFVGVTLLSVEHIDFYGVDRATQLPLINVEIPTRLFFFSAPLLVATVFGYFHLYLIRLWDVLSKTDNPCDMPLGDAINPWLISDAFLHCRNGLRGDSCTTPRAVEGLSMLLNIALAWLFGLIVLGGIWWLSIAARDILMTGTAAFAFASALVFGGVSLFMAGKRARAKPNSEKSKRFFNATGIGLVFVAVVTIITIAEAHYIGRIKSLIPINMEDASIVERPKGWLPYDVVKAEYRDEWCARRKVSNCADFGILETQLEYDWSTRRAAELADMSRPDWSAPNQPAQDFSRAQLPRSFMVGIRLREASLRQANLRNAQMEAADLRFAALHDTNLREARMESADFRAAEFISSSPLPDTGFRLDLRDTRMNGAELHMSRIFGTFERPVTFNGTNLNEAKNFGGALRYADLTPVVWDNKTDFRDTFLDSTVSVSPEFRERMGNPCQWLQISLDDHEFIAIWRWWVETHFQTVRPKPRFAVYNHLPPPTPARLEELGLTNCEPNQPFGPMPADRDNASRETD